MAGIGHSGAEASERLDGGGEGAQRLATMGNSPQARLQDTEGEVAGGRAGWLKLEPGPVCWEVEPRRRLTAV